MIEWFLRVMDADSMTGAIRGVREWPYEGGLTKQPARLVAAVDVLQAEMALFVSEQAKRRESARDARTARQSTPAPVAPS